MQSYQNWLKYWKNSLADAQRLPLEFEKENPVVLPFSFSFLEAGTIPSTSLDPLFKIEEQKINQSKGIKNPSDKRWQKMEMLEIYIALFTLNPKPEYLQFIRGQKAICPFWIPANVARNGELTVHESFFPYMPREFLDPVASDSRNYLFSSVENVDKAAALKLTKFKNWKEYYEYVKEVFAIVAETTLEEYQEETHFRKEELTILVQDEQKGASAAIIALYEHLIEKSSVPPLLKQFITLETPTSSPPIHTNQYLDFHVLHMGQMGSEFPLSISQRKSLYTLLQSPDNTVVAVNGPPGTGKTTLLQSVVANAMVRAAIEGKDAPIILACSTNNQAVTNINESFSKTVSNLKALEGRWLPDFKGYATFLPSTKKDEIELKSINYRKLDGKGTFEAMEEYDYLSKAKDFYLNKVNAYLNKHFLAPEEAAKGLQHEIKKIEKELVEGGQIWKLLKTKQQELIQKLASSSLEEQDINTLLFWSNLKLYLVDTEGKVKDYFKKEPFFRKVFCFLGISNSLKERELEVKIFFRDAPINTSQFKFTSKTTLLEYFSNTIEEVSNLNNTFIKWAKWKEMNDTQSDPVDTEQAMWDIEYLKLKDKKSKASYFFDEIDLKHRHKAFQLAVHYFEGRWLEAMQENRHREFKKTKEEDQKVLWRTRAMLTPCFVSTFFMAPKFFSYSLNLGTYDEPIWKSPPLLSFIDLLIVDESGQVSPEVGVAIFSLAKKAIVVGDVKQIEPVWNILPKIDIGNLIKFKLLKTEKDNEHRMYEEKGFLASSGSIMKMAQNACHIMDSQNKLKERGLMLTEHRRCNDEIIAYCNDLAYSGMLKPMKGKAKSNPLFPPMLLLHVEGNSNVVNKDRFNPIEVEYIVQWLIKNREKIQTYFVNEKATDSQKRYPKLEDLVGIVTPFKGQKSLLLKQLKQSGFDVSNMKIGTVHALQGAEKEIVLFSTVYGDGDAGTMFFDRDNKPNMLNVAVSRAKESFIVIGNERIFKENSKTPSGILRKHLKTPLQKQPV